MKRTILFLALLSSLAGFAGAQTADCLKKDSPVETFDIKGIATDAAGPLASLTVIAFPYLLPGSDPVARFWLQDVIVIKDAGRSPNEFLYKTKNEGSQAMSNPMAVTDETGTFSLKVPKGIFQVPCGCKNCAGYKRGELALGVFSEVGAGKWQSTRELIKIKADPTAAQADLGQLTFEKAGPDK
jgi:hypothetical protein